MIIIKSKKVNVHYKTYKEILNLYGTLACTTWKKLNVKKLVSKSNYLNFRKQFYQKIYKMFSKSLFKEEKINRGRSPVIIQKLHEFMRCLPKINLLNKIISKKDFKQSRNNKNV